MAGVPRSEASMTKVHVSLSALPLVALVALGACTVQNADSGGLDDGGAGTGGGAGSGGDTDAGGSGGEAGTDGGAGNGGSGGVAGDDGGTDAPSDPCKGVPTTGVCIDSKHISSCLASEDLDAGPPSLKQTTCPAGTACGLVNGAAQCQLTGECLDGAVECKSATVLRTCSGGSWTETACGGGDQCLAQPGVKPVCGAPTQGTGDHVGGTVEYEYRPRKSDLTGYDAPVSEGAQALFVAVYDGSTLIGTGVTDSSGAFDVPLVQPTTTNTSIFFFPLMFDASSTPLVALAKATTSDSSVQTATEYWSWGVNGFSAGQTDVGTVLIDEAHGSGAVYIYQWLAYGMQRDQALVPNGKPLSLLALWADGNGFDCGSCFYGPNFGGGEVDYGGGNSDHFATTISISGTTDSPEHWSSSVVNHEFGHYTMQTYSLAPGEGGKHLVSGVYSPGLAYSEGWATFAGQAQLSGDPPNPIYFNQQHGTTYWVNIDQLAYDQGPLPKPDPNGAIDQPMNEMVVAGTIWALWGDTSLGAHYQGLGDQAIFDTLTSSRLVSTAANRGYKRVDLVDFLDAVSCSGAGTEANVTAVTGAVGFPYDVQNKTCQ